MNAPPLNILLVEDDPNDVLLIRRAFQKAKLNNPLYVVQDGEEAASYLSGQNGYSDRKRFPLPMLMLLDLKLPRKTGLELLAWVREQKSSVRRLPVVVLTSSRQTVDINRAYDLGVNSYLVKPGEFDSLLEMIKTVEAYWLEVNEKPELEPAR
jgi:CheY-like chemotaxis protein